MQEYYRKVKKYLVALVIVLLIVIAFCYFVFRINEESTTVRYVNGKISVILKNNDTQNLDSFVGQHNLQYLYKGMDIKWYSIRVPDGQEDYYISLIRQVPEVSSAEKVPYSELR